MFFLYSCANTYNENENNCEMSEFMVIKTSHGSIKSSLLSCRRLCVARSSRFKPRLNRHIASPQSSCEAMLRRNQLKQLKSSWRRNWFVLFACACHRTPLVKNLLLFCCQYDGCVFYRAEKDFVVQGGLTKQDGYVFVCVCHLQKPKKNSESIGLSVCLIAIFFLKKNILISTKLKSPYGGIPLEYNDSLKNKRGTVTLARWEDTSSATSEFFINLKDRCRLIVVCFVLFRFVCLFVFLSN